MKNLIRLVFKITILIISLNILLTTFIVFLGDDKFKHHNDFYYLDQS